MSVSRKRHACLLLGLVFFLCAISGLGVQRSALASDDFDEGLKELNILMRILVFIQEEYFDPDGASTQELVNGAIHGMVSTLDHYSLYLEKDEAKEFNDQTQGAFSGLGIQIEIVDGWLTVIEPMPGTPAEKAGLLGGDRISAVEGESTKGINIFEAQKMIKGETGTEVTLTIARRGEKSFIEKTITRAHIETFAIAPHEAKMLDDVIGYIRLRDFTKDAADELENSIRELQTEGMRGLVFDLRDNVGGLLDVAVDICDLFIKPGKIIVSHKDRRNRERIYKAHREAIGDFCLTVLVNEYSASASEIVAGCIQDHKRGILIGPMGHKTFGKGSVQTMFDLKTPDGAQLKLTTAKYYTPLGHSIHDEKGLKPDIFALVTDKQRDAISAARKTGYLPPDLLGMETPKKENKDLTVEDVFEKDEDKLEEEMLYDIELYTAYQCLKGAEVFRYGEMDRLSLADSRN